MPTRTAEAEWKGNLAEGGGRLKVGSGAFEGPYTFRSRFEDGQASEVHQLPFQNARSVTAAGR